MNIRVTRFSLLVSGSIVLFSLFFFWFSSQAAFLLTGCGSTVVDIVNAEFEARIVQLVNEERAKNNLPPMKHNPLLSNAARYHAADMDQDDYFLHDTYDNVDNTLTKQCSWVERIKTFYPSPRAENIAKGFTNPESVMRAWMDSAGHRNNILGDYWEIGPGFVDNEWVQDFGSQPNSYPLIINREANNTDSISVNLYIYGDWKQMRLRNDDGAWGDWQPFSREVAWTLANAQGVRTVEVELSDDTRTLSSNDSIELVAGASIQDSPTPTPTIDPAATPTPSPDRTANNAVYLALVSR